LNKVPRCLYDEDVVGAALKGNVRSHLDDYRKRVDAGKQSLAADGAATDIYPRAIGGGAPGCVRVREFHVADRSG
jgi:hypothetical protein